MKYFARFESTLNLQKKKKSDFFKTWPTTEAGSYFPYMQK